MTELVVEEDCGNSPRKQFLREFYGAIADRDEEDLLSRLTDDVRWTIVGEETLEGKGDVAASLDRLTHEDGSKISVDNIITHGDTAAANGRVETEPGRTRAFCDVFTFDGYTKTADIETVETYVIETE